MALRQWSVSFELKIDADEVENPKSTFGNYIVSAADPVSAVRKASLEFDVHAGQAVSLASGLEVDVAPV